MSSMTSMTSPSPGGSGTRRLASARSLASSSSAAIAAPGSRLQLRDPVDQVDDQRLMGARDFGQELRLAAQLVPGVLLGDLPGDSPGRLLRPYRHSLGHRGGLLDAVVRQNCSRFVSERELAVLFGLSHWPRLLGSCPDR